MYHAELGISKSMSAQPAKRELLRAIGLWEELFSGISTNLTKKRVLVKSPVKDLDYLLNFFGSQF
jgi:hypothetical protein